MGRGQQEFRGELCSGVPGKREEPGEEKDGAGPQNASLGLLARGKELALQEARSSL